MKLNKEKFISNYIVVTLMIIALNLLIDLGWISVLYLIVSFVCVLVFKIKIEVIYNLYLLLILIKCGVEMWQNF